MWFNELPYNSIHTWEQLYEVFIGRYFPLLKKLNHKDKLNFVALPGQFVSSFGERFTTSIRSFLNQHIDDRLQKVVFDTTAGGPHGGCTFEEIVVKLEKIS